MALTLDDFRGLGQPESLWPELKDVEPDRNAPLDEGNGLFGRSEWHLLQDKGDVEARDTSLLKHKDNNPITHMPSHLHEYAREICRNLACGAATLMLHHRDEVHYSQGSHRWDGIDSAMMATHGRFPHNTDCSASATWWEWQGLAAHYHRGDIINAERWMRGFTGTMAHHGKKVRPGGMIRGDLVLYGDPWGATGHVAMCVGRMQVHDGSRIPMVISHGSEAGPFFLPWNYRNDVYAVRRYI